MPSENTKRIAKNTLMLYVRMLIIIIVGLYTSRVVLNVLGESDFGTYAVVGGIVSMFSFLNASLSGASARFITFELGGGNLERLKSVFAGSLTVHIIIAAIVFLLAETIGLWLLETKLVIPVHRMQAARIIYQFSVISCLISITQVPYNAIIIAHEKMQVYAYIGILEVLLKLGVVISLLFFNTDKLILYGVLICVVSFIIAFIYRWYCIRKFKECRFALTFDKKILYPMLSFSGWDFYGNFSVAVKGQGVNVILNLFFGTLVNAASGIASQVQSVLASFANNFLLTIKPQVVKKYAAGQINSMINLVMVSSKMAFALVLFFSLPLILENEFVLKIWLKNVPQYAVVFCQFSLIINLFAALFTPILYSIHAIGRVKFMSIVSGTIYMLSLPLTYLFLKMGGSPIVPYILMVFIHLMVCFSYLWSLKRELKNFSVRYFIKNVLGVCLSIVLVSSIIPCFLILYFPSGWLRLFLVSGACIVLILLTTYYWAFDKNTREFCVVKLKNLVSFKFKKI